MRPESAKAAPAQRSRAIEVLRAAAILLVLGCHVVIHPDRSGAWAPLAQTWYRLGWAGVDLFFVLSGFLVSGLLFAEYRRTGAFDVRRFLVRRSFKIWPAYFAYLALLAAWLGWQQSQGKAGDVLGALGPNLLHLQNYLGTPREHTWSLAVEEHFYLALALAAGTALAHAGLRRALRVAFVPLVVLTLAGLAAWRHAQFASAGRDSLNLFATHLRCDGLLIGTLLAYLHHFRPTALTFCQRRPGMALITGCAFALPWMLATPDHNAWTAGVGLTAMYLGFALVVIGSVYGERTPLGARVCATWPLRCLGTIGLSSYGIYLWHVDLAQTPGKKLAALAHASGWSPELSWFAVTTGYVALACATGALLTRLIERPALALRERYFGTKPTPAVSRVLPVRGVAVSS